MRLVYIVNGLRKGDLASIYTSMVPVSDTHAAVVSNVHKVQLYIDNSRFTVHLHVKGALPEEAYYIM